MTLAALSTLGQYPTTKTIKGTPVVIMTLDQAKKIDNNYAALKDSIESLKRELKNKSQVIVKTDIQRIQVVDSLTIFKTSLVKSNLTIDSLINETKRIQKLEYIEYRTRKRIGYGLGAIFVVWVGIVYGVLAK